MNTPKICYWFYFPSIFLFCISMMQFPIFATSSNVFQERDNVALQAFKSLITRDPEGILNSWNDSRHFCNWEGITCSHRYRRVTVLDLDSRGLVGSLSPHIGNLSFLRKILLWNNTIGGEIPHEFGYLFRLEILDLSYNSLVGEIPANLSYCSRLTVLFLDYNKLVGKIPIEFVSLYNLKVLSTTSNNLTGGIPPFRNLTSLKILSLTENNFGGNIPDSLGQLKQLKTLDLSSNNLIGKVPLSMYNLSSLRSFSLSMNQLHGSLPPNFGLTLPNLRQLLIAANLFAGSIPTSISNASKIQDIAVSMNSFIGKLTVDFRHMEHLKILNVAENNLESGDGDEMSFMNSLVNCSNLQALIISGNLFRGELPHSIVNLSSQLKILDITQNQIYGSIPLGISNLVRLKALSMGNNQITGTIPNEMGMLRNLGMIFLGGNKISGKIPSSVGNISTLERLLLYDNKLSGVIPSSIGKLKSLSVLTLDQNELSGIIPEEIFDVMSLSMGLYLDQNHLIGPIPSNIGNLRAISEINVSNNNLSGEIPSEIGLCSSLEKLSLESNFFNGSIPKSLSTLRGIQYIDLSRNNLSGQIPQFLETLALKKLNLSYNNLEGEVPAKGIFANASGISVSGNNRLCGGIAKLRLPNCINIKAKKKQTSRLLKILISTSSTISGLVLVSFIIFYWLKKKRGKQKPLSESALEKTLLKVSYESLLKATNGFSSTRLLGVGSFGSVYKGIFDEDGTVIAVKVLNLQRRGASKSFLAECEVLRNIRHRNLVKIITSCSSIDFQGNDFKALIYEYMSNGSLENWLHPAPQTENEELEVQNLSLLQRINIGIDVASAIDYLHHHCQEPILHCDLKPSNVLLDKDMTAHVGDFGLARFGPEVSNPNQSSSVGVRGTIGYAAPEYGLGSEVSTKGDIYSYGILLLEMVTRKKPTDSSFEGDLNLHNFARMALPDQVVQIVDPVLLNDDEDGAVTNRRLRQRRDTSSRMESLISVVRIGVACSMESPQDRMNITDAVHELQLAKKILLQLN